MPNPQERTEIGGQLLTHEQIVDLLKRYKRALEGLTCGGSEFVNDPEYCLKWIRARQDFQHETILKLTREVNKLRKEPHA